MNDTPIQEVARLLGHGNVQTTIDSYSAWLPERQKKLERHQRLMWENDPLHRVMMGLPPLEKEAEPVAEVVH